MTASIQPNPDRFNRPLGLDQRGRAAVDCLGTLQKTASSVLRARAKRNFAQDPRSRALQKPPNGPEQAILDWVGHCRTVAEADPTYRLERFIQAYVAYMMYEIGIPAVENRRAEIVARAFAAATPPLGVLELDPDLKAPSYFDVEWHLRPGGWEGYDLYGALGGLVVQPIFRHGGFAAVPVGANLGGHRQQVVATLPKLHYDRIYEPGCGAALTLMAVHAAHPEAELIGSDLSAMHLADAHKMAEERGVAMTLKQRDAVYSGEPDESMDAVVTFALHHELPREANVALLREMFRILKPGGDIVLSDPPPFREVSPFHAAILDWDTENREEPFFSAACASDWQATLREIGFIDISAKPLGEDAYPWVTLGTKPR